MSTTAGDQINGALRLLGVLAEGESPSAATSQDALAALNQMIDSSKNRQRLFLLCQFFQAEQFLFHVCHNLGCLFWLIGVVHRP